MYDSRLLLDESPLVIQKTLARTIGLNESIVLQQLHYWLLDITKKKKQDHFKEGYYWVWNTLEEWHSQFDWWSLSTVRRVLEGLESEGLVITGSFNRLALDKTKWYRIDYVTLRVLTGESRSFQHPEVEGCSRSAQNGQTEKTVVLADNTLQSQQNQTAQIEQMDCSNWTNASAQIEQSTCSDWAKPSAQIEQSNNHRITTKTSNKEEDTLSRSGDRSSLGESSPMEVRKKTVPECYPQQFKLWWDSYRSFCGVVKPVASKNHAGKKSEAIEAWDELFSTGYPVEDFLEGDEIYRRFKLDEHTKKGQAYGVAHGVNYIRVLDPKKNKTKWQLALEHGRSEKQKSLPPWRTGFGAEDWNESVLSAVLNHLKTIDPKRTYTRAQVLSYACKREQSDHPEHAVFLAIYRTAAQTQSPDRASDSHAKTLPPVIQELFDEFAVLNIQLGYGAVNYVGLNSRGEYLYSQGSQRIKFDEEYLKKEIPWLLKCLNEKRSKQEQSQKQAS